ncbi:hypothetical protein [Ulvibacter litoralis]|uniref:Chaperone of endosialidase n=1 Tax=Ulvibacter litoralis TaxID=227084 RepID=A0A1G7HYD0_9FLAO|nr:hypothetical protein [Ulvibacter litoralis]GHC63049.1 hypothetical protein GCM10008083_30460 [Ulvibacter litoralis]SDF05557.1 hypothetical protein SAMN05421855_1055 [Ulvibacter litoralis]
MKKTITYIALLFSVIVVAQNGINYKAVITDNDNVVANQVVAVQFRIIKGAGMSILYQETHTPTTDANGMVFLSIGEGTVNAGVFENINWGSDDHFLNVRVNTGGGLINMGTTQFNTVPYALHSKTAETALNPDDDWTVSGNKIYRASGDVGIGTTDPNSLLHLKAPGFQIGDGIHFETSGATGEDWYIYMNETDDLNFRNDAFETISFQKNTGNIGIGTTDPDAKLHVEGNLKLVDGTQAVGRVLTSNADGLASWQDAVVDDGDWVTAGPNIHNGNGGNVGIGTASPSGTLHIKNTGTVVPALRIQNSSGATKFSVNTNGGTTIGINNTTGAPDNGLFVAGAVTIGTTDFATGFALSVDGDVIAEDVVIQDSGAWPDYVFENDYKLLSIDEMAQVINEKKHLPGIPSAKDVEANGILIGDMQKRTMEKIEELSLYIIQLHERLKALEIENEQLKDLKKE